MSRSVHVGRDSRGYVSTAASKVVWRTEVMEGPSWGYVSDSSLGDLLVLLAEAKIEMINDGIDPETIRVGLDHDSEPDYGDVRITPKLVMTGERPATKAEVEAECERQEQTKRQRVAEEKARLQARLNELERRR